MTKADLIARLEKEGGSRELDAEIFRALGYHIVSTDRCYPLGVRGYNRFSQEDPQPKTNITTSLDAAIALCERVLPGWSVLLAITPNVAVCDVHTKPLGEPDGKWPGHAQAPKPATALCIALLRALEEGK